ncbi:MAG: helix-turn-helix domain-containing protein [Planctomycetes bacterium]|nr:helix-turn-helix domain-containing protein [Planctomycetota bacterium]
MADAIAKQNCVLISCKTLAKMLSLSPRTIWRLRSSGALPKTVSCGSSIRWKMSDVILFLESDCNMAKFQARKEAEKC